MFERVFKLTVMLMAVTSLGACNKMEFSSLAEPERQYIDEPLYVPGFELTELSAKTLGLNGQPSVGYSQVNNSENRTSINFQVIDGSGDFINDLNSSEVIVTENGVEIPNFRFTDNANQIKPITDIVFLVDITCSMTPTINSAKSAVIDFIRNSRAAGYHTRMCLSTFGDYTVQRCSRFYDNDPSKASTMTQVNELINEVTRLSAGCGAQDPGGRDLPENPLQAIMDAESAPYAQGSQRFGILLTDADFLHTGSPGALGANAPSYTATLASLSRSQLNLFVAAPDRAGYSLPFQGNPSLAQASSGEYFNYPDLVAGRITFANILSRITLRIQTTYTIEYMAEKVPGLDPSLPMARRNIEVRLRNPQTGETLRLVGTSSSMPNGQQALNRRFKVSDLPIKPGSISVRINGVLIASGFTIVGNEIDFPIPPVSSAKVEISFEYARLKDSVKIEPIVVDGREDMNSISIFLNNIKASGKDLKFERSLDGNWLVTLNESVFADEDPFEIRLKSGLRVRVFRSKAI